MTFFTKLYVSHNISNSPAQFLLFDYSVYVTLIPYQELVRYLGPKHKVVLNNYNIIKINISIKLCVK